MILSVQMIKHWNLDKMKKKKPNNLQLIDIMLLQEEIILA